MSDIRLDPATLRWVIREVGTLRDAYAVVGGGDPCNALAGVAHDLRRALNEVEARPPLPSDWLRACEGTAMGEPSPLGGASIRLIWGAETWPSARWVDIYPASGIIRAKLVDTVATPCTATKYATPDELRAALDRLAAEAKP